MALRETPKIIFPHRNYSTGYYQSSSILFSCDGLVYHHAAIQGEKRKRKQKLPLGKCVSMYF